MISEGPPEPSSVSTRLGRRAEGIPGPPAHMAWLQVVLTVWGMRCEGGGGRGGGATGGNFVPVVCVKGVGGLCMWWVHGRERVAPTPTR